VRTFLPFHEWTLEEWLAHLEHRLTQEIQLGLTRIKSVASQLQLLSPQSIVITVGGTNGKGSTVAALEAIYHQAGYQVGAYTSPHLMQFNERIRINAAPITDTQLCQAFSVIEKTRGLIDLTYFEMTTLAALLHFKQYDLDVMILEVGLGGRLDATNIIDSDIAIITTIALDHQDYLGTTLNAIGFEKAGILRTGKPFIYADIDPPDSIIEVAHELQVQAHYYKKDYFFAMKDGYWDFNTSHQDIVNLPIPKIQLQLACAALMASRLLHNELPISKQDYIHAMEACFIPARLQLQRGPVSVLYDVAHNPQAVQLLADTIKNLQWKGRVFAVFSALKDKDVLELILPMRDYVTQWFVAQLKNKRAASAQELLKYFNDAEIKINLCYTCSLSAFKAALGQAQADDLIIVYGSFYTVSPILMIQTLQESV
jgi:dihydrofolate synthase / folylpolyglutamate synthase